MDYLNSLSYPAVYLDPLFAAWQKSGLNPDLLIDAANLRHRLPFAAEARITGQDFHAMFIQCERYYRLPEPFSLKVAQEYNFTSVGLLGLAVISAEHLRDILTLLERYLPLYFAGVQFRYAVKHTTLDVSFDIDARLDPLQPFSHELIAGVMKRFTSYFHQVPDLLQLDFAHRSANALHYYESYFGCPVRFGADTNRLTLSTEHLHAPPTMAEAATKARLDAKLEQQRQQLRQELSQQQTQETCAQKISRLWLQALTEGEALSLEQLAQQLNTTSRTLERRLAEEGTRFSQVIHGLRLTRAQHLLKHSHAPIAAIAGEVGFQDSNAFTRFFRQALQQTPSEYRRLHQVAELPPAWRQN